MGKIKDDSDQSELVTCNVFTIWKRDAKKEDAITGFQGFQNDDGMNQVESRAWCT